MNIKRLAVVAAFLTSSVSYGAGAPSDAIVGESRDYTPVQLSLVPSVPGLSFPWWCDDVRGFRLNLLAGETCSLSYLDLGTLANLVRREACGLQVCGLYNRVGTGAGLVQLAGLVNRVDRDCTGLQLSAVYNEVSGLSKGLAVAALNHCGTLRGAQVGIVNNVQTSEGFQFGIVNYAASAENGLQIGLINIMPGADVPVSILCNAGFWRK